MSKDKKTKEKSTKKALIILISALAICFLAGYIVGKIMGKVEKTQSFDAVVTAIRAFAFDAIPILFAVVSFLGCLLPVIAYTRCSALYKQLQKDRENDDLWDTLEDKLNVPMIMSNIFSIIELCLFFCFLYDVEKGYGKVSGYQSAMWVIAVALFVITMAIEILIPKLTVDIEKKLNPEKRGNALDFQFHKVWMSSCDEAEWLIVYRAGYQAFLSTNVVCLILCIVIFIFTFLFKTDIMGFVYVCMILLVNNVSYMTRAAKLERRR